MTIVGEAYCWGAGIGGRLGNGSTTDSTTPTLVSGGHTYIFLSSYDRHTCAIRQTGEAYCWGLNESAQLGIGLTDTFVTSPVQVAGGKLFRTIAASAYHTCGISLSGEGFCWGNQSGGRLGNGVNSLTTIGVPQLVLGGLAFSSIAAGGEFTCGLTTTGQAYCWGLNYVGQLGNGALPLASSIPTAVSGGLSFTALDVGVVHGCGTTVQNATYCWGGNEKGELGDGTKTLSTSPTLISGGLAFRSVQAGAQYTCGVEATSGRPYCWGDPFDGKLGHNGPASIPSVVSPP